MNAISLFLSVPRVELVETLMTLMVTDVLPLLLSLLVFLLGVLLDPFRDLLLLLLLIFLFQKIAVGVSRRQAVDRSARGGILQFV